MSPMSEVAAANPLRLVPDRPTAYDIIDRLSANRMVGTRTPS